MPFWKLYHPTGAFTPADKKALAERITTLYTNAGLPKFYVGVVFQEVAPDSFFIGAERADKFVRISIDHIARTLPSPESRQWWIKVSDDALAPFIRDRGLDWEYHIDETPFDLWSIQGFRPPTKGSDDEARWIRENRPTPLTVAAPTT
jgi:phenylpyruvate tautomerase PptA (4-oxalocrotonate tautomerase family)